MAELYGVQKIIWVRSMTFRSLREKLAVCLSHWNSVIKVKSKFDTHDRQNCAVFVGYILENLLEMTPERVNGQTSEFRHSWWSSVALRTFSKQLYAEGYSRMEFVGGKDFNEHFGFSADQRTVFRTHQELDQFFRRLKQIDEFGILMDYVQEKMLLLGFDRVFWVCP